MLFRSLAILLGLENRQIGYAAAFMQAPIEEEACAEMPKRFAVPGRAWKLKRCIYGLKQAPRNFFIHTGHSLWRWRGAPAKLPSFSLHALLAGSRRYAPASVWRACGLFALR